MATTRSNLESVLAAARKILSARADDMLTSEEWDELQAAVQACLEPDGPVRQETFSVDDSGALVRSVVPARGEPYQHRCPAEAFQEIAHAIDESKEPFVMEDLRLATSVTWTQIAVTVAFLKERGVIVPASGRNHKAASKAAFEDAMVEFTALKDQTA